MSSKPACSTAPLEKACCGSCDKHDLPSEIAHLLIFRDLQPSSYALITAQCQPVNLGHGQSIFLQDDNAEYVYVIRSGWIKLYRETIDGQEAIIDILTRGHVFGDTSLFNGNIYQYGAQAIEQTSAFRLPINLFQTLLEQDPKFSLNLMNTMARYRREQDKEVEHRTLQNASQRIACFLLRLLPVNHHSGSHTIQIPYDKLLLAGRLGMKPETLSRGLARLKDDLNVIVKGGAVTIPDIEALIEYACSACTHIFPCDDLK